MKGLKIVIVAVLCFGLMGFEFLPDYKILFVGDSLTAYKGGWQHQYSKMRGADYDCRSEVHKESWARSGSMFNNATKQERYSVSRPDLVKPPTQPLRGNREN